MSQALLVGVVIAAGLACPLHMWWQNRRARRASSSAREAAAADIEVLRARQAQLSAQIAQLEKATPDTEPVDRAG